MKTFEEILKKYKRYIHKTALSFNQDDYLDDLISEGNIALWNAWSNYKEDLGEFHPYALVHIKGRMKNFLTVNGRIVHLPRKKVEETLKSEIIFNQTLDIDSTEFELEDIQESIEIDDDQYFKNKAILKRFNELKPSYQYIVSNYLGLDPQIEAMTLKEIGDELGITREAVRQQYELAIKKLKK